MSHDTFNASSTATWIECSYSALNAVPEHLEAATTAFWKTIEPKKRKG